MAWPRKKLFPDVPAKPVDPRLTAAVMLAAFGLCAGLRLADLARGAGLSGLSGPAVLMTHDSYAWIAGADRINQYSDSLLAIAVRLLQALTGFDSAAIGLVLPAVVAPLVVIPVCLLAAWWRLPEAAPVAATLAGASLGYLLRTWLGVFDTDVLTLLFPLALALLLIVLFEPLMQKSQSRDPASLRRKIYLQAFGLGLLVRAYLLVYPSGGSAAMAMLACAVLPALVLADKALRYDIAVSALLILMAGAGSWHGLAAAAAAAGIGAVRPSLVASGKAKVYFAALLAAALLLSVDVIRLLGGFLSDFNRYGRIDVKSSVRVLPSTIQSVQEAQATDLRTAIDYMSGSLPLFIAGMGGLAWLVWRRPAALCFAPLLVLGLASTVLGSRFSMYGGAAVGAGLGFGWALALRDLGLKAHWRWLGQLALLGLLLAALAQKLPAIKPAPILTAQYAEALQAISRKAAFDAQLWEWWDLGYAAQYYGQRMTFADGSRNTAEYTLPLARVYFTDSPLYACRLMSFTACRQKAAGEIDRRGARFPIYENPFLTLLHELPPTRAQKWLQATGPGLAEGCSGAAEQYLVVSWDTVKIAKTVSELATWDLAAGSSKPATIFPVKGAVDFDLRRDSILLDGTPHAVSGFAILTDRGAENYRSRAAAPEAPFIVGNKLTRELFAVDERIFRSLMVQMLVAEPKTFEPYFTLVADKLPYARVYRLNPGAAMDGTARP